MTLGGSLHRSQREHWALPPEARLPTASWSTMYVNRRGYEVGNSYNYAQHDSACLAVTLSEAKGLSRWARDASLRSA